MVMKIVSWNVNSIKARQDHAVRFLSECASDILMLQELKGESFPHDAFASLGYRAIAVGQKAYNGVAILYRGDAPPAVVLDRLPGDDADLQARYLEVDYHGIRLINIYLPNGNPVGTEKYDYKLAWMDRLYARVRTLRAESVPFLIGGDFNVIPENEDCHDPAIWAEDALFLPATRAAFRRICNLGLYDAFRVFTKGGGHYTFWDYQAGAWAQNKGIRIDHFLVSPAIADRLISCVIDSNPRAWDKASDHTPIMIEIS